MVTLETALAIPVLLVVALSLLWLSAVGVAQLRVGDAARAAARVAARGDGTVEARSGVRQAYPGADSEIDVDRLAGTVSVTVRHHVVIPLPWFDHWGVTVSSRAVADLEEAGVA